MDWAGAEVGERMLKRFLKFAYKYRGSADPLPWLPSIKCAEG
jgi:hypothetical protein